jgi:hypothetical protein
MASTHALRCFGGTQYRGSQVQKFNVSYSSMTLVTSPITGVTRQHVDSLIRNQP